MRFGGAAGKENVGISNEKTDETSVRRKTKGSLFDANQNRVSRGLRNSRKANLMGNGLIFQYLLMLRWGDEVVKVPRGDGSPR